VKVDDYFKDKDVQIPYRRDLGQLNAKRNMVQHNACEPEASGMDEWRVFTEKFLRQSFERYFGLGFDEVTQVDLVADEMFRSMLRLAADTAENGSPRESLVLTTFALEFAVSSCVDTPSFSASVSDTSVSETMDTFVGTDDEVSHTTVGICRELWLCTRDVDLIGYWVKDIVGSVAFLARGVSLVDYERFVAITPEIVDAGE
jgi:hypothetical protein